MTTDTSESKRRKRKTPSHVSPNACTNCKKARAKCDGSDPDPCSRCVTRSLEDSCHYELHIKSAKEDMVKKIKQLEAQNQELMARLSDVGTRERAAATTLPPQVPPPSQPSSGNPIHRLHRTEQLLGLAATPLGSRRPMVDGSGPTLATSPISPSSPRATVRRRNSSVHMIDVDGAHASSSYQNPTAGFPPPLNPPSSDPPNIPLFPSLGSIPSLPTVGSSVSFGINPDDPSRSESEASAGLADHLLSLYCSWWGPMSPIIPHSAFPMSSKRPKSHPSGDRFSSTSLTSAACALGSLMMSVAQKDPREPREDMTTRSGSGTSALDQTDATSVGIYFAEHALRELEVPFEEGSDRILSHSTAYALLALYEISNARLRRGKSFLQCALELVARFRVAVSSSADPNRLDTHQLRVASRIESTIGMLGAVTYSALWFPRALRVPEPRPDDGQWAENESEEWWPHRFLDEMSTTRTNRTIQWKDTSVVQKLQVTSGSISEFWYAPCEHVLDAEAREQEFMRLAQKLGACRGDVEQLYAGPRNQMAQQERLPGLLAFRVSYAGSVILLLRPLLSKLDRARQRDVYAVMVAKFRAMTRDGRRTLELYRHLYGSKYMHIILGYWCAIIAEGALAAFEHRPTDWTTPHPTHDAALHHQIEERDGMVSFALELLTEMAATHRVAQPLTELIRRAARRSGFPGFAGPPTIPPPAAIDAPSSSSYFASRRRSTSSVSPAALTIDTCLDTTGCLGLGPPPAHIDSVSVEAILNSWSGVPEFEIPPLLLSPEDVSPRVKDDREAPAADQEMRDVGTSTAVTVRRSQASMSGRSEDRTKMFAIDQLVNP